MKSCSSLGRDAIRAATHVGICVADLERSTRFYRDGLGFEMVSSVSVGCEFARLMELDGDVRLDARLLRRDGLSIELLSFDSPRVVGAGVRRALNERGFTHLSLRVEDIDVVAEVIRNFGGAAHQHTRCRGVAVPGHPESVYLYCSDPDGVRIELVQRAGPIDD